MRYNFNKGSIQPFNQERLAKEDIRLLLEATTHVRNCSNWNAQVASDTRIEMLIGKLKRMEKQQ